MSRSFLFISVFTAALFVGVGCSPSTSNTQPAQTNVNGISDTQITGSIDTSDWETFTNTTYGYSIRYSATQSPWEDLDEDAMELEPAYPNSDLVHFSEKYNWSFEPSAVAVNALPMPRDMRAWAKTEGRKYFAATSTVHTTEKKVGTARAIEMSSPNAGELGTIYRLMVVEHKGYMLLVTQDMPTPFLNEIYNSFTLVN